MTFDERDGKSFLVDSLISSSPEQNGARVSLVSDPPEVPDYELVRRIGIGAYGEVWLGRSRVTGTWNAVKIVWRGSGEVAKHFDREYGGIQKYEPISRADPSLMPILHVGRNEKAGFFFYVMELADDAESVESESVMTHTLDPSKTIPSLITSAVTANYRPRTLRHDLSRRERTPISECVELGLALTSALAALHTRGLVHRDIKPSNIIFVSGKPKLADIGLVARSNTTMSLVGTAGYAAPEGGSSPRADLYSLGKVLYEASTGKDWQQFPEPLTDLRSGEEGRLWPELNEVILKACKPDPAQRYESAEAMQKDLLLLQTGQSLRRLRAAEQRVRMLTRTFAVAAILGLLAGAGHFYQRRQSASFQRLAEENRNNLVRFHVANGVRQMDEGDLLGSLPWFVEALRLDEGNRAREEMHRRRIESVLKQAPKLVAIGAHEGAIEHSELSSDGSRVVTASSDRTARVWNAETGHPITPPLQHAAAVRYAAFSPDGSRVLTASADHTACVWDARSGQQLLDSIRHDGSVEQALFTPDGERIVTASEDGTARIWDVRDGHPIGESLRHWSAVDCLALSRDGTFVVTGARDGEARVWSAVTGKPISPTFKHRDRIRSVAFSQDGLFVATGSSDDTACIWESQSGRKVWGPFRHVGTVWHVEFSPDGSRLLTTGGVHGESGEAHLWNLSNGEEVGNPMLTKKVVRRARFSPDGRWVASCGQEGTAQIWDSESKKPVSPLFVQDQSVWHVQFSADGRRLLISGKDGTWRLWDLAPDVFEHSPMRHGDRVAGAQFSPDGKEVLTASSDEAVRLWDSASLSANNPILEFQSFGWRGIFSPDRKWIATAGDDGVRLHPTADLKSTAVFLPHPGEVMFSGDGETLALFSRWDRTLRIYELDGTGSPGIRIEVPFRAAKAVLSHKGDWIVAVGDHETRNGLGQALIWNTRTGKVSSERMVHAGPVWSVAFSPDDRFVVTASGTVTAGPSAAKLWRVPTGEFTRIDYRHNVGIPAVEFSPDGRWLGTGCGDGSAQVWEAATGRAVGKPLRHRRGVISIRFSPDGRRVLTASNDRTARIWDAETGDPVSPALSHQAALVDAVFSPDGDRVLTASLDGTARVWEVPMTRIPTDQLVLLAGLIAGRRVTSSGGLLANDALTVREAFQKARSLTLREPARLAEPRANWHSLQAMHCEQERDWHAAIFHLDRLIELEADAPSLEFRRTRARVELERKQARGKGGLSEQPRQNRLYPRRDPTTPPELIDLSNLYNAPMLGNWYFDVPDSRPLPLKRGLENYHGIEFDIRGIVHLRPAALQYQMGFHFPNEVRRIRVGRNVELIHFLHGLIEWDGPYSIGSYIVHYKDGNRVELPLLAGTNIQFWKVSMRPPLPRNMHVAWQGQFPVSADRSRDTVLYRWAWENPRPATEVDSIDLRVESASMFLLGITVE
ncbi:MAG: protein kinase [Verrucomicrobiales bacterium]|nr:protein kinase [Verrucomicrobiales bacterium]